MMTEREDALDTARQLVNAWERQAAECRRQAAALFVQAEQLDSCSRALGMALAHTSLPTPTPDRQETTS